MISLTPAIQNWITMLRTTQLPQTTGHFEKNGSYCALGILCFANGQPIKHNWNYVDEIIGLHGAVEVYRRNDSGMTFAEIADWAEVYFSENRT